VLLFSWRIIGQKFNTYEKVLNVQNEKTIVLMIHFFLSPCSMCTGKTFTNKITRKVKRKRGKKGDGEREKERKCV
jgi:hypothetical protein